MEDCIISVSGDDYGSLARTRAVYLNNVYEADFNRCNFTATGTIHGSQSVACLDTYIYGDTDDNLCDSITIRDSTITTAFQSASATATIYAYGARIRAKSIRAYNSTLSGRAYDPVPNGGYPSGFGLYVTLPASSTVVPAFAIIRDSVLLGYYRDGALGGTREGYGLRVNKATRTMVIVEGNSFPLRALPNYTQTGAINLEGSTAGAAYRIVGNVFAQADNATTIKKHSDSSPAADYYVANNVFGRDLD